MKVGAWENRHVGSMDRSSSYPRFWGLSRCRREQAGPRTGG